MDLETIADIIPSMTGEKAKRLLRQYASRVKPGHSIIEVGVWLGACTAQLALGIMDSHTNNMIHIYDRFCANNSEIKKAEWQGVVLYEEENTRYIFKGYMERFPVRIKINTCNIKKAKYKGQKIGLYVDDAAKRKEYFDRMIKVFFPYFVANETILFLMDYFYFERTGCSAHKYQYEYMQAHKKQFKFIQRIDKTSSAIFRYKGK